MTVAELLRDTVRRFSRARLHYGHGTANARDEAAWLISSVLGFSPSDFSSHQKKRIASGKLSRINYFVERRIRERIPVAYLVHEAWLDEHSFYVDRRAIVPRSYIAELLHDRLRPWLRAPVRRVLDLCTGSGCLAVLVALAYPRAQVDAADVSPAALEVARINRRRHRLGRRMRAIRSDLFRSLGARRYHLIVCNPPYVTARSMRALPPEYRYEPALALAGGADGLDLVRRIIGGARNHLLPGGLLVCEIGGNRKALERTYPNLPFLWPESSAGPGCVFMLEREQLPAALRTRTEGACEKRPTPARARR